MRILVHTLGAAMIDVGDCRIKPNSTRKFSVLLHLAAERGRRIPRALLQEMIFPDRPDKKARHSLRELVYQLRQLSPAVDAGPDGVELIGEHVGVDCDAVLERKQLTTEDVRALSGGFLPGYSPIQSEAFIEWYEAYQARSISALTRVALKEVERARDAGEWEAAERAARAGLALDSLNEAATVALAEMLFLGGAKVRATQLLDRYDEEVVRISPDLSKSVRALRRRIEEAPQALSSRFAPRFVGRSEEMGTLRAALRQTTRGQTQCIVVSGEPGIGKSRLLSEFRSITELDGVRCESVVMQPHDANRPMGAFVDLVPGLLRLPGALGCSPESMGALKRLTTSAASATSEKRESIELEVIAFDVTTAILDLCESIAGEAPLVLIIEDAHWIDPFSVNVVSALLSRRCRSARILLLISTREPRQLRHALRHSDQLSAVSLKPLPRDATAVLIDEAISPAPASDVRSHFLDAANGNPLFALSLANDYRESQDISTIPATLLELLSRRIDALSHVAVSVLATSIAFGKHCTTDRLLRALEVAPMLLLETVAELTDLGLLNAQSHLVSPAHPLIADVVAARQLPATRAIVNFRVAEIFEDDARAWKSPAYQWEAGIRWRDAGNSERALAAFAECARHAMEIGRAADAARILNEALELPAPPQSKVAAARELIKAADVSADTALVLRGYSLLCGNDVIDQHDELELAARRACIRDSHLPERVFEMTLKCLRAKNATCEHRILAATIALKGAYVAENASQVVQMIEEHVSISDLSQVDEPIRLEFELLLRSMQGDWDTTDILAERLMTAADGERRGRRVLLQHNCGVAFSLAGKPLAAIDAYERAFETAGQLRSYSQQCRLASLIAGIYADLFEDERWDAWICLAEDASRVAGSLETFDLRVMQVARSFARGNTKNTEALLGVGTTDGWFTGSPVRERWGKALLLMLRARIGSPTESDDRIAKELLHVTNLAVSGVRDFEIAAAAAIIAARDPSAALRGVRDYLATRRHGRQLVDRQLSEVIREIEGARDLEVKRSDASTSALMQPSVVSPRGLTHHDNGLRAW